MYSSLRSIAPAKQSHSDPLIEILEQRIAPATFTVTTTADSGTGSLRQAILSANAASGPDLIDFALDGEGPFVIQPLTALPAIKDIVTIDGYTQFGASKNTASVGTNAVLQIVLDGSLAAGADGLVLTGAGSGKSKITGLSIINFEKSGVVLESKDISVVGNFIGVDFDGMTSQGNHVAGVFVKSGTGHVIGTGAVADRNLISGNESAGVDVTAGSATITGNSIVRNPGAGIFIEGALATGSTISGNWIGVEGDGNGGTRPAPNGIGIHIYNAANNTIGGNTSADRNWIAGNTGDGVLIDKQDQYFTLGEYDGFPSNPTNTVTQAAFTAAQVGEGAPFTTLFTSGQTITLNFDGSFDPGFPSLFFKLWGLNSKQTGQQIASVTFDGVAQDVSQFELYPVGALAEQSAYFNVDPALLTDGHLTVAIKLGTLPASQKVGIDYAQLYINRDAQNAIIGNTIGGPDGPDTSLKNGGAGVHVSYADRVTIGDGSASGANLISGNDGAGIYLQYGSGSIVRGNVIGSTTARGLQATNATGVLIESSYGNVLGGSAAGDRNVISGNSGDGVEITAGASNNQLINNVIGTDLAGLAARPNGANGVSILSGANYNYIGIAGDPGNVISGNLGAGILVSDSNTAGNQIVENFIGTSADGTSPLANQEAGIRIQNGATNTHVGDGARADGNTISGNLGDGISIFAADENVIDGNYIGTAGDGLTALGNSGAGVVVVGNSNVIATNVISGNRFAGVQLTSGILVEHETSSETIYAQFNIVRGNLIGLDANADGENPLPNADGVVIDQGASNNLVGGSSASDGNQIAHNASSKYGFGDGVRVGSGSDGNAILGNSIHDNAGYGINLAGGNHQQIAPTQTAALIKHGTMIFKGNFTSTPNTTFRIEMFVADGIDEELPDSEGETLLGFFEVTTDATGFVSYRKTLPTAVPAGTLITATATALDAAHTATDTSEFAGAIKAIPTIAVTGGAIVEGNTGDKSLNFLISLGAIPEAGMASVSYATGDFSNDGRNAAAGIDYESVPDSTLSFLISNPLADPLTRQLSVTVHGDTEFEIRERFKVLLSHPVGVGFDDGEDEGVGTIIDDDQHTFAVGAGTGSKVQIFNSVNGSLLREFNAFEARYKGGARVATGDVTGDGINDIIVSTGAGGGARVRVFDGADTSANPTPIFEFRPFGASYRGALNVAAGDVNGDGRVEIIASTGAGSVAEVRVIDVNTGCGPMVLTKFKAFNKVSNGVRVASGDLDGDGLADIIATNGVTSEVRTFHGDGTDFTGPLAKFQVFGKLARGGVQATAGDLDGDGRDDLVFSPAAGFGEVRSFLTTFFTGSPVRTFNPFPGFAGVRLAITDVNSDGIADIVAAQNPGRASSVHLFDGSNGADLMTINGVPAGGVFVG
ncbi:MAG: right-handed parallel beta-helix repeat-containing protein [Chthoniobacteraceae bacterium]